MAETSVNIKLLSVQANGVGSRDYVVLPFQFVRISRSWQLREWLAVGEFLAIDRIVIAAWQWFVHFKAFGTWFGSWPADQPSR